MFTAIILILAVVVVGLVVTSILTSGEDEFDPYEDEIVDIEADQSAGGLGDRGEF